MSRIPAAVYFAQAVANDLPNVRQIELLANQWDKQAAEVRDQNYAAHAKDVAAELRDIAAARRNAQKGGAR